MMLHKAAIANIVILFLVHKKIFRDKADVFFKIKRQLIGERDLCFFVVKLQPLLFPRFYIAVRQMRSSLIYSYHHIHSISDA